MGAQASPPRPRPTSATTERRRLRGPASTGGTRPRSPRPPRGSGGPRWSAPSAPALGPRTPASALVPGPGPPSTSADGWAGWTTRPPASLGARTPRGGRRRGGGGVRALPRESHLRVSTRLRDPRASAAAGRPTESTSRSRRPLSPGPALGGSTVHPASRAPSVSRRACRAAGCLLAFSRVHPGSTPGPGTSRPFVSREISPRERTSGGEGLREERREGGRWGEGGETQKTERGKEERCVRMH